jgi:hypothetical protein
MTPMAKGGCRVLTGRIVAWVLSAALLSSLAAGESLEKRLMGALPQGKEIAGWTALPRSDVYGEGEGLTKIYDGGYKQYTDNGALAAGRRVYLKGSMTAEVVLHYMVSGAAAQRLARIKRTEYSPGKVKALKNLPAGWSGFTAQESGSAACYVWSGKYLATAMIAGRKVEAAAAARGGGERAPSGSPEWAAALMARKAVSKALAAEKSGRKVKTRKSG